MKNDRICAEVFSTVVIPSVEEAMRKELGLKENERSCAIFTASFDDFIFLGLDEATKKASVRVSYVHSFYGGGSNASSKLQGEGIGIIAGETVGEVRAGVDAVLELEESQVIYGSSHNDDDSIVSLVYPVARTGTFFESWLSIPEGSSIAYLAGPPVESIYAVDAALKVSGAKMGQYFAPAETNCGGAILIGSFSQCVTACAAYADAVGWVADNPKEEIYGI